MGRVLRERLRQSQFESPTHEAILNVIVAAGHLREHLERVARSHGVTGSQYNVLRILRGAQPIGLPRCEIVARLLERAPDVTRLLDRLTGTGLVERVRSQQDGRHSIARITRKGMALLERVDLDIRDVHRMLTHRIRDEEAEQLSVLLEKLYEEDL